MNQFLILSLFGFPREFETPGFNCSLKYPTIIDQNIKKCIQIVQFKSYASVIHEFKGKKLLLKISSYMTADVHITLCSF